MNLEDHLNAKEGSFILDLRCNLKWKNESFKELLYLILEEAQKTRKDNTVSKQTVSGIWFVNDFVRNWTEHENFPKKNPQEYYDKAYKLLNHFFYYSNRAFVVKSKTDVPVPNYNIIRNHGIPSTKKVISRTKL